MSQKHHEIDTIEVLKSLGTVTQQITHLTATHQKATQTLSHFVLESANPERAIVMLPAQEKAVLKRLKKSVNTARDNLRQACSLRDLLNELMSVEAVA